MIHHVDFAVSDIARSRAFYVRALAPLGLSPLVEIDREDGRKGTGFGSSEPEFWIGGGVLKGRLHVAFLADTRAAVDAFYTAAVEAGGRSNGAPGLRPHYGPDWYAAYVADPDGHNIEALCLGEKRR